MCDFTKVLWGIWKAEGIKNAMKTGEWSGFHRNGSYGLDYAYEIDCTVLRLNKVLEVLQALHFLAD